VCCQWKWQRGGGGLLTIVAAESMAGVPTKQEVFFDADVLQHSLQPLLDARRAAWQARQMPLLLDLVPDAAGLILTMLDYVDVYTLRRQCRALRAALAYVPDGNQRARDALLHTPPMSLRVYPKSNPYNIHLKLEYDGRTDGHLKGEDGLVAVEEKLLELLSAVGAILSCGDGTVHDFTRSMTRTITGRRRVRNGKAYLLTGRFELVGQFGDVALNAPELLRGTGMFDMCRDGWLLREEVRRTPPVALPPLKLCGDACANNCRARPRLRAA